MFCQSRRHLAVGAVLFGSVLVLFGCDSEPQLQAGEVVDDAAGDDAEGAAGGTDDPAADEQDDDEPAPEAGGSGSADEPSSSEDEASGTSGGDGAAEEATGTGDGGSADDDADGSGSNGSTGGTPTRPSADSLNFTATGSVLEPTSGPSQDHRLAGCPIRPHAEQNIIECEFARGVGGEVLLTIEEFAGDFAATVWERSGIPGTGPWGPVWAVTYGATQPNPQIEATTAMSSAFRDLPDVVILDVDLGGSGGMHSFEVIGWPQGASGAQILAVSDPRPAATLRPAAGRLLLTANHLAEGDATCCPSEREIVVFDHPSGTPVPASRTYVPRDDRLPVEVALRVYAAWRDQDVSRASDLLTPQAQQTLSGTTGPGEDTFAFRGRSCASASGGYVCTFTGGGSGELELTVGRIGGDWKVEAASVS